MNSALRGVTIRQLAGGYDLATFNRFDYVLNDELRDDLLACRRRSRWMWLALHGDHLLARAAWWGHAGMERPSLMDVFDLDQETPESQAVAVELIRVALDTIGIAEAPPDYVRFMPVGWHDDPDQIGVVAAQTHVLATHGGRPFVERLRMQWTPTSPMPTTPRRLRFGTANDRDELVDLLTRVLSGTLDAYGQRDMSERTPREIAIDQLDKEFPDYCGPRDWWTVGYLPDGEPVGVVIPTRNDYGAIVAYLGVVPEHRGHGYVDELLAYGTSLLIASGAALIKASTDVGNAPMVHSFHRCGYVTSSERIDFTFQGLVSR